MSQRAAFGRVPCMDTAGSGRGSRSEDERGNIADTTVDRRVANRSTDSHSGSGSTVDNGRRGPPASDGSCLS